MVTASSAVPTTTPYMQQALNRCCSVFNDMILAEKKKKEPEGATLRMAISQTIFPQGQSREKRDPGRRCGQLEVSVLTPLGTHGPACHPHPPRDHSAVHLVLVTLYCAYEKGGWPRAV